MLLHRNVVADVLTFTYKLQEYLTLPYLTLGVDVAHRQHPALRPPVGPIALPR